MQKKLDGKELSLNKQVCLAFQRYRFYATEADLAAFVDLATEWRRQGRVGSYRTVLEKIANRARKRLRPKKVRENSRKGARKWGEKSHQLGIGVHSDEMRRKNSERCRQTRARQEAEGRSPGAKTFIVTTPDGEEIIVHNLAKFCRENGLNSDYLKKTAYRPDRKTALGGWSARRYTDF